MTRPAALLFDMDGLLLDTETLFLRIGTELLVDRGFDEAIVRAMLLGFVGKSGPSTRKEMSDFVGGEDRAKELHAEWHDIFNGHLEQHVPLRPGVRECLTVLHEQNFRMAVVTSTYGQFARKELGVAGLLPFFELVKGGDEVSATKPDPAPYVEAAEALGVAPDQCFAFEDSDTGTRAALAAGCRVGQIPDLRPEGVPIPELGQIVSKDLRTALERFGLPVPELTAV